MTNSNPIQKALSHLLYSVVERGVCRIVTSQQPSLLPELKQAYKESLPEHHHIKWLTGKIDDIEGLKKALARAGIRELRQAQDVQDYMEICKQHLINRYQAGKLEIWAISDVQHLAPDVHSFLSTLLKFKHGEKPMLSLELWGNAQLDVFSQSGAIEQMYKCPLYPIQLGQQFINIKSDKYRFIYSLAASLFVGVFLGFLTTYQWHGSDSDVHVAQAESTEISAPEVSIVDESKSDETPAVEMAQIAEIKEEKDVIIDLDTFELEKYTTPSEETGRIAVKAAEVERLESHWYFALSTQNWDAPGEFLTKVQQDTTEQNFFIQFGAYKRQDSLLKFFETTEMNTEQYTICYVDEWGSAVIIGPGFPSYDDVVREHQRLTEQAVDSAVIDQKRINTWQCNYKVSLPNQSVVAAL